MLSLAAFLLLLALGLPIAFAMMAGAVLQIVLGGNGVLLLSLPQQLFSGMESYGLLALPIFILLGELMNRSGAGRRISGIPWAYRRCAPSWSPPQTDQEQEIIEFYRVEALTESEWLPA